jgi:hypothetical protein
MIITSEACLSLLLVFNRPTVQNFLLSWFVCLDYLKLQSVYIYALQARPIVICLLKPYLLAKIRVPTNEKVAGYKQAKSPYKNGFEYVVACFGLLGFPLQDKRGLLLGFPSLMVSGSNNRNVLD